MSTIQGGIKISKIVIIEFLNKCIAYADSSIKRKEDRGDDAEVISEWNAYRNYTQYALEEIEKGDLDHWFIRETPKAEVEMVMDELNHATRSKWLSAAASPRPCLLYTSPSPRDRQKSRMPSSA